MADNIDQDLLDEIRYDIKVKDLMKGHLVMAALGYVKRDTQTKALLEVVRAEEAFSIPLLAGVFVNSPAIAQSFPHLKETMYAKILGRPEILLELISRQNDPNIKSFLVDIIGEIRLTTAVPMLVENLKASTDQQVTEAIIAALGAIGDATAAQSISAFLDSDKPALSAVAVDALGELASPESMQLLWQHLGHHLDVDRKIIDIFAKARTPEALEKLNATLTSQHAHIRTTGKQKLSEIGLMSVRVLSRNLSATDSDLVIHSLNVLGDIGEKAAVPAIRELLHSHPEDPNVRFAAYEALGRFAGNKGAFTLAAGLEDPVDHVRMAAARAIDRNYNPMLAGGIRNLTRADTASARNIIETIVLAQCENIFLDLLEENFFRPAALNIIANKSHPDVKAYYIKTLKAHNHPDLAKQITLSKAVQEKSRLRVFAVDDSRMMLNIYRTVLHNLGYEPTTFEFPSHILERVERDKPDALITDLNMPEITGIDLTRRIRRWYSKEELPIIMITTQDEISDNEDAIASGINGILRKPFNESLINRALNEFAGLKAGV